MTKHAQALPRVSNRHDKRAQATVARLDLRQQNAILQRQLQAMQIRLDAERRQSIELIKLVQERLGLLDQGVNDATIEALKQLAERDKPLMAQLAQFYGEVGQ